jgi:hypothetical protein
MSPAQQRRVLWLIFAAVLIWGLYHAVGAYRFNHNPYRPLVVVACVGGYLAIWALLLWRRRSRGQRG